MSYIIKILTFLQGKKTTISTLLALLITLSLSKGWIDNDWAIFLNGVLIALGITTNVATAKLVK